jgi:hypothetical protein
MHRMLKSLEAGLHSRNGLVRKGSAFALRAPKRLALWRTRPEQLRRRPPILANSFPKSGTHLLDQIADGFPDRANYGTFVASLTSSFQMRPRTEAETLALIRAFTPGELIRAHLFYLPSYVDALRARNVVHFFIYRDPRDVVVSSCHYLRTINRWHRWRPYFQSCASLTEALLLAVRGLRGDAGQTLVPDLAARFAPYEPWIAHPEVCAVRFEDLRGPGLSASLERMLDFYAVRSEVPLDRAATLARIHAAMVPEKSHTFRKGAGGGWREAFTPECKDAFKQVTGDLLLRLGYERSNEW